MVNKKAMKIVNSTYHDIDSSESTIQKTPISKLVGIEDVPDGSLIHIVVNGKMGYESKKISTDDFKQKMYEAVQNTFKTSYWDTHELNYKTKIPSPNHDQTEDPNEDRPEGTSFADLVKYLQYKDANKGQDDNHKYTPDEVGDNDADAFVNHIYYDFDVLKRYMVLKDGDIQSEIDALVDMSDNFDCYFAPKMKLTTDKEDNNIDLQTSSESGDTTENDFHCQMEIKPGNKISNTWSVPETGNLVVYGWLDSSKCLNNKSNPDAYCVLEGKINGSWMIISVCPVTAAKNMTYVSFNILAKKGLPLRARTGFTCGSKSGQHPNEQDGYDSLSNSTPNGFRCVVYSNIKLAETNEERTDEDDDT